MSILQQAFRQLNLFLIDKISLLLMAAIHERNRIRKRLVRYMTVWDAKRERARQNEDDPAAATLGA